MKNLTIITALSLALIITGINTSFAKQNAHSSGNPTIRVKYQVTINLYVLKPLCNRYQVEMLDANGHPVAPAQGYDPGTAKYTFEEQTLQTTGIRIARLVPVFGGDHFVCEQELYTVPSAKLLTFTEGQVYYFDLFPTPGAPK
jgi:hypothetical protein